MTTPQIKIKLDHKYFIEEPHIIVFEDGGTWYAIDTKTKAILKSSTSKDDVVKYVFDNAPDNSIIAFRSPRPYRYFKPKYVSGGYDLSQLTFKIKKIIRTAVPYDDPNLSITITDQRFTYSDDSYLLTKITEAGSTTLTLGDGIATITGPSTGYGIEYYVYNIDTLPFCLIIMAEVDSWNATLGSVHANPVIGIIKDVNNRVLWLYDTYQKRFNTYRVVNGTAYDSEVSISIDMSPPFKLIMAVNCNGCYFFYEKDGKVKYVGKISNCGLNFNDSANWRNFKIGFGAYVDANCYVALRRFKMCYAPIAGICNPAPITDKYGAPLFVNGRLYFTASILASPETELATLGYGLFSIDRGYDVRFEKVLITKRVDLDNKLYGDDPGHIVYDPDSGKYIAITSSFASEACWLLLSFVDMNLEERGVQIIESRKINLNPRGQMIYDPHLIYDLTVKKWRMVFVNPSGYIYVAENSQVGYDGWSVIASATVGDLAEGCKVTKVNGKYYVTLANNNATNYMCAVDYPTLANMININADKVAGTWESPPWVSIVPVPVGNRCKYLLLTMDKTTPRNNLVIMEAEQLNDGYEFPILLT